MSRPEFGVTQFLVMQMWLANFASASVDAPFREALEFMTKMEKEFDEAGIETNPAWHMSRELIESLLKAQETVIRLVEYGEQKEYDEGEDEYHANLFRSAMGFMGDDGDKFDPRRN